MAALGAQGGGDPRKLDAEGEKWVAATLKKMSLDDKVGQLLVSSFGSEYLSTDSDEYDALVKAVHDYRIGGFHVFGGTEQAPDVLLDANYGTVTLGQPLAAASLLNRLQAIAPYPLLNTADFETGAGFRDLESPERTPRGTREPLPGLVIEVPGNGVNGCRLSTRRHRMRNRNFTGAEVRPALFAVAVRT